MQVVRWTTIIIITLCLLMLVGRKRKPVLHHPNEDRYRYSGFFIFLFAATLIIVEGFRQGYEDTFTYRGIYLSISDDFSAMLTVSDVPGWSIIQWLLKRISKEPQFFFLSIAAFITICDVVFIKKYSSDFLFSIFLYFLFSFLSNMNGIRQITAACIMMLAFRWVLQRRTVPYLLLMVLLSTIHKSILVVIPLYFVFSGKRWNPWVILLELGCVFSIFVPGLINALIGTFFEEDYAHYIDVYTAEANILHVFIDGVPFIMGIIYHLNNKDNVGENRVFDVLINMQAISFGFMVLATSMAQYARVGMYMRNATALVVPFLIKKVLKPGSARFVNIIAIVLYLTVFLVEIRLQYIGGHFRELYLDFGMFR